MKIASRTLRGISLSSLHRTLMLSKSARGLRKSEATECSAASVSPQCFKPHLTLYFKSSLHQRTKPKLQTGVVLRVQHVPCGAATKLTYIYIEENTTKIANNLSVIAENYQNNSHEPDLGRFLYRVNKLIPRKVRDANLIRKVTSPTLNRPVSQYESPRAVALASSACVDKTTKIVTEFTRKDSSDLKRAN